MLKVYLAGPIKDCSDEEANGWRDWFMSRMNQDDFEFLSPMLRDYRDRENEGLVEGDSGKWIVEQDKREIFQSDVVLVYFESPTAGTMMEILFAWENSKTVVIIDCSGKSLSPWIRYHSTFVVKSLEEAEDTLHLIRDESYG